MAPIKRRNQPQIDGGTSSKRIKKEQSNGPVRSQIAEVESDSDPVVESDTNTESGEDDGVSWPGEEEPDNEDQWDGLGEGVENDNEDGGISPAAEAADVSVPAVKPKERNNASISKESHAKQKAAKEERKAAKPNADSIARSKKLWEKLRIQSKVPIVERRALISELFDIIAGNVKEYVFKHDSVRVIQTAVKYANKDQRKMIATELKGDYKTLCESRYGKHLVNKLVSYGDKDIRDMVVPEFYGHVRRLIRHPEASWTLDDIYREAASTSQKASLLREWYGSEFAIFKPGGKDSGTANLKEILEANPEKRKPIMRSLHDLINTHIQKKTTAFHMLHDAMLMYYLNLAPTSEESRDYLELIKGDEGNNLLKNLVLSASGVHLVCLALANSNAKDRKVILRAYKGMYQDMAYDPIAHKILLTAYDVIDDTVMTGKLIFPELLCSSNPDNSIQQEALLSQIRHNTARISLLYLATGKSRAYLPTSDLDFLNEIHAIRTITSKKGHQTRRLELLSQLLPHLLTFIAARTDDLVRTRWFPDAKPKKGDKELPPSYECQFITETILSAPPTCLAERIAALEAIVALVKESENGGNDLKEHLAKPTASRMLKNLVQGGRFDPAIKTVVPTDPRLGFHDMLFSAIKPQILDWATGAQSFVVLAMMEAGDFKGREELRSLLVKEGMRLEEAARGSAEGGEKKGEGEGKSKAKREEERRERGNRGAKLLLEKLR